MLFNFRPYYLCWVHFNITSFYKEIPARVSQLPYKLNPKKFACNSCPKQHVCPKNFTTPTLCHILPLASKLAPPKKFLVCNSFTGIINLYANIDMPVNIWPFSFSAAGKTATMCWGEDLRVKFNLKLHYCRQGNVWNFLV